MSTAEGTAFRRGIATAFGLVLCVGGVGLMCLEMGKIGLGAVLLYSLPFFGSALVAEGNSRCSPSCPSVTRT